MLLIGSTVCMAQDRQKGKVDREKRIEQIITDLGLNEKQAKDFKAAMKKCDRQREILMKDLRAKRCKRREKREKLK